MPDQLVPYVAFLRAILPVINTAIGAVMVTMSGANEKVPLWLAIVVSVINALALYGGSQIAQQAHAVNKLTASVQQAASVVNEAIDKPPVNDAQIAEGMKGTDHEAV